jgi:hypothetical protein
MGKRIDYRFRALVGADSLEAMLVDYFRSKDADLDEKDMVMWANCACWIPLAQKKDRNRVFVRRQSLSRAVGSRYTSCYNTFICWHIFVD